MNIELITKIISLVCSTFATLYAIISILYTIIKKHYKNLKLDDLRFLLRNWIEQAEELAGATGAEKLQSVLQTLKQYCTDNRYKYDEGEAIEQIERYIEFSKNVNYNKKPVEDMQELPEIKVYGRSDE